MQHFDVDKNLFLCGVLDTRMLQEESISLKIQRNTKLFYENTKKLNMLIFL